MPPCRPDLLHAGAVASGVRLARLVCWWRLEVGVSRFHRDNGDDLSMPVLRVVSSGHSRHYIRFRVGQCFALVCAHHFDHVGGTRYNGLGYAPIPVQQQRGTRMCKKKGPRHVRRNLPGGVCAC